MKRVDLLGIRIFATDLEESLQLIIKHIRGKKGAYFCFANIHLIMEGIKDLALQRILNHSEGNFADGMGVAWGLKILGNSFEGKVRGTDLMLKLCAYAALNEYKVFFYGNTPETLNMLSHRLSQSFLGIRIAGQIAPPFRDLTLEEEDAMVRKINECNPDILFVSLGAPKQERWMGRNKGKIKAIQLGVGAAFDFITGKLKEAPVWMQNYGLEWAFRLSQQPGKTMNRMSLLPDFALRVLFQKLKKRNKSEN